MNNNHGRRRVRRARRHQAKAQIGRILLTVALMTLVAVVSIGGTMAWLTDASTPVTNTFATSGIDIKLTESDYDKTEDTFVTDDVENHSEGDYQLIPSKVYPKDPTVTVDCEKTNVDIYLFVKFNPLNAANEDAGTYLDYQHIWETDTTNWHALDGVDNVWYREVLDSETTAVYSLIPSEQVTVKNTLVKAEDTTEGALKMPAQALTMTYTAYAIQQEGFDTVKAAWDEVSK